jgi:hypothetical protein
MTNIAKIIKNIYGHCKNISLREENEMRKKHLTTFCNTVYATHEGRSRKSVIIPDSEDNNCG